ncbi:hypothetical protein P4O66_000253 [Electrophorus voltai]|uniref:Fibronectin type-III domain-containing protein n=1 Tax=Electrophorus voltai TaxID=2609070 RepID=A0AAD9DYG1_9TELE|nr:hypothetical protein P4O66_000253 [Electrophorus voltai]
MLCKAHPYFLSKEQSSDKCFTGAAPSAPPQQVTVLAVGDQNSTSVSISWDPPPTDQQNGIIQEYKVLPHIPPLLRTQKARARFVSPAPSPRVSCCSPALHPTPTLSTRPRHPPLQVWCLGNESRFHVNKTVDAAIRSVVVSGLQAGVRYRVEVAAGTSAGTGVKSEPQTIGAELQDVMTDDDGTGSSIADVVKQPAFIAGLGGACWIVLMGFSAWLYWRRKKRKGLSNYAGEGPRSAHAAARPTPRLADAAPPGASCCRPGLLKAGDPGLPWLADSWPSTSLPASGMLGAPKDHSNFGRGGKISGACGELPGREGSGLEEQITTSKPSERRDGRAELLHPSLGLAAGPLEHSFTLTLVALPSSGFLSHSTPLPDVLPAGGGEKTGTMLSDGAIYSSIDFTGKAAYSSPARGTQATPYATTQILQSSSFHELAVDRPEPRWKASLRAQQELASLGYSLTDSRACANAACACCREYQHCMGYVCATWGCTGGSTQRASAALSAGPQPGPWCHGGVDGQVGGEEAASIQTVNAAKRRHAEGEKDVTRMLLVAL